ncbi:MAG: hypothetical protein RI907_1170 [Pseudomonadota bacterium]|jgi:hypothetical protein
MNLSATHLVLRARQLEIAAMQHLASRVALTEVIGQLIHALQHERGATSLHLASGCQRFVSERQSASREAQAIEARLRAMLEAELASEQGPSARMLSLTAWVMLDLDSLPELRQQVAQGKPTAHDSLAAFSRVVAGLVELVFHMADTATEPHISRLLVAFVHLVQGKEAAGQERALGAQLFASGQTEEAHQQRIVHLIDAQEHSLQVFEECIGEPLRSRWQQHQLSPKVAQLERLRRTLCTARSGARLDPAQSEDWFDLCTGRVDELWAIEAEVVKVLRDTCAASIQAAQQGLQDSEGLIRQLRANPSAHIHAVDRFFDNSAGQPEAAPVLPVGGTEQARRAPTADSDPATVASLKDMLQQQSTRLSAMEAELESARRTLQERKVIERAKGVLMSRLGLTEEAAYRALQKAAMDHNKRLVDMAEAALALPDVAFGAPR